MSRACAKATELIEKQSLFELSLMEKVKLKMHLRMCSDCSNYKIQSEKIDELLQAQSTQKVQKLTLSKEIKEQIIRGSEEQ